MPYTVRKVTRDAKTWATVVAVVAIVGMAHMSAAHADETQARMFQRCWFAILSGCRRRRAIESKHINSRTRIKRLVRRTLCFSKTEQMHDLVIGLFINRYEFGRAI